LGWKDPVADQRTAGLAVLVVLALFGSLAAAARAFQARDHAVKG